MSEKSKQHKVPEGMVLVPAGEFIMGSTDQWDDFLLFLSV